MPSRSLFRISRFILLKLPGLLKFLSANRKPSKKILLLKTDGIGDYILFRNFLEEIKKNKKFKGYSIHLLGNTIWKDIAIKYDSIYIDYFFFIIPDDLVYQPFKLLKLGWFMFKTNYEQVLQPSYARTFLNDGLAGLTACKKIIGFGSDNERISPRYKKHTDKFYSTILILPLEVKFEFERLKFFIESVTGEISSIKQPSLPNRSGGNKAGVIIFPGAGHFKRNWPVKNFVDLIKYINDKTDELITLAGSPADVTIAEIIIEAASFKGIINLTGKTTTTDIIELISNSRLVIANETSAIHIAAAVGTQVVCVLGGGHFGRFAPYPGHYKSKPFCVYYEMECFNCNWSCIFKLSENESFPCVKNVDFNSARDKIISLLVPAKHL